MWKLAMYGAVVFLIGFILVMSLWCVMFGHKPMRLIRMGKKGVISRACICKRCGKALHWGL